MSTSYSPALDPQAGTAEAELKSSPFFYVEAAPGAAQAPGLVSVASMSGGALDQANREEALRQAARAEGAASARAAYEEHLARVRDGVRVALAEFAKERTAYYQQVEAEVVQLALAIARKILHREAQVDPLMLAGVVRVALDQIESNTKVVVRVHPEQAGDARSYLQHTMGAQSVPEVVDDPTVELDRCVLQTELGTAELGIEPQMKEIEQGLLDLLAKRPRQGA